MRLRLGNIGSSSCLLEIGDKGTIPEEIYERGRRETVQIRGQILFEDGSSAYGTREIILGDPTYRFDGNTVPGWGFRADEYFARPE